VGSGQYVDSKGGMSCALQYSDDHVLESNDSVSPED
jgi:hypothetical protein